MITNNRTTNEKNTNSGTSKVNTSPKRPPYKIELCIIELLERGEAGLIELEALQAYGETCLHSTISTLSNKFNLELKRGSHQHNSKRKVVVNFTRYSLADEQQIINAKTILSQYRTKRGIAA